MNIANQSIFLTSPNILQLQPSAVKELPPSLEVYDSWRNIGAGIGRSGSWYSTAIGEYFERRHFNAEVPYTKKALLGEYLDQDETNSFASAFIQTSKEGITSILSHRFHITEVFRLKDFSKCGIPSITLSLGARNYFEDNRFYPRRDTCGSSFHLGLESSLLGAIKEILERNFLLRFWLTNKCSEIYSKEHIEKVLSNQETYSLFNLLSKHGNLKAFNISDPIFPGECALVIYGAHSNSSTVRYCAGMSYASSSGDALNKSLLELWQTFRFLNLFETGFQDTSTIKDPYQRHFIKCNSISTYEEISNPHVDQPRPKNHKHKITLQNLVESIESLGASGFLYVKEETNSEGRMHYSRFVSPDFFMHMNNAEAFNLENLYSRRFLTDILKRRLGKMVPFP
ncbi:YcaO-like family protein [Metapseudomonas furukawaii]|uniref:YcaO-like family protein n=1 Tax=Metapseudomonas furukawaii TaxID=1149133 RepID=UPI0008525FD5|nr:YcaO-like family protein [Pseudomonas furukawaii]